LLCLFLLIFSLPIKRKSFKLWILYHFVVFQEYHFIIKTTFKPQTGKFLFLESDFSLVIFLDQMWPGLIPDSVLFLPARCLKWWLQILCLEFWWYIFIKSTFAHILNEKSKFSAFICCGILYKEKFKIDFQPNGLRSCVRNFH